MIETNSQIPFSGLKNYKKFQHTMLTDLCDTWRQVRERGEKFSVYPTTNVKLRTSGHFARTQTGASVTATLV